MPINVLRLKSFQFYPITSPHCGHSLIFLYIIELQNRSLTSSITVIKSELFSTWSNGIYHSKAVLLEMFILKSRENYLKCNVVPIARLQLHTAKG